MRRINQVFHSSRAAVDLASIMVGIIIIGLIGGVIAATVFAVIPWSQDKAAKQQLDNNASDQSAYRGLSTDRDSGLKNASSTPTDTTDPNQVVLNSTFTGSSGLAVNDLLIENRELYCVQASVDGSDYNAYVKSGSGKVFQSSAKGLSADEVTDISKTCLGSSVSEPELFSLSWDFDSPATMQGWGPYSSASDLYPASAVVSNSTVTAHSGTRSLRVAPNERSSGANISSIEAPDGSTWKLVPGKTYIMSAWVKQNANLSPQLYADGQFTATEGGVSTNSMTGVNTWKQLSVKFVAKNTNQKRIGIKIGVFPTSGNIYYVDDVLIQEVR